METCGTGQPEYGSEIEDVSESEIVSWLDEMYSPAFLING